MKWRNLAVELSHMPGAMTNDEVNAFLDSRPGWIVLNTMSKDGFPHSIPIGYFRIGDDVYMGCRSGTQKLKNIARNPKASVMLEAGSNMGDIKGVCIQGTATVFTEPVDLLRFSREGARLRGVAEDQLPTEARPGSAYIRVAREKVISWDYAKPG